MSLPVNEIEKMIKESIPDAKIEIKDPRPINKFPRSLSSNIL